ncbi:MAG: cobalt-zinc-cadmium efflux system protein, partial [Paraglaciecola sp.]
HHHAKNGDSSSLRLGWAFALNVGFTIIEFIGGWLTNSTAIMADAVHDLGDSLAIASAWILNKVGSKQADRYFSYGYKRLSLFGALINGVVLIVGCVWVLFEALPRLFAPQMPVAEGMFVLAIVGVVVNGYAAYKLSEGESLNERVLNWHLIEDVMGWVAVLLVSIVLMFVNWPILDPILSIGFTLFILFNVFKTLRETLSLFLQAVPDQKVQWAIRKDLLNIKQIADLHHLHFWSLDGEHHVLTAHLLLNAMLPAEQLIVLKDEISRSLKKYDLAHTTIEFEFPEETCRDKP